VAQTNHLEWWWAKPSNFAKHVLGMRQDLIKNYGAKFDLRYSRKIRKYVYVVKFKFPE
jgi:hypothetical protein